MSVQDWVKSPDYQWENKYTAPWNQASVYNLHTVTQDQVAYTMLSRIKAQNIQSTNGDTCVYLTEYKGKTLKCIAGHLLPDYLLRKEFLLDLNWLSLEKEILLLDSCQHKHNIFILYMQDLHDSDECWRDVDQESGKLINFRLTPKILKTVLDGLSLEEKTVEVINRFVE